MIDGVSLRSPDVADALNPQKGLYTLITRGREGVSARIVGSIRRVLVAPDEQAQVVVALARPATRIVSLTITEKGYGLDPKTGGLDRTHPAIAADLADPNGNTKRPRLHRRRAACAPDVLAAALHACSAATTCRRTARCCAA